MFIRDLFISLTAYGGLAISFFGFGWITSRWISVEPQRNYFRYIWLGWATTLFIFQILHIFVPITAFWSIVVLGIGVLLAISSPKAGIIHVIQSIPRFSLWFLLVILGAVWVSVQSMQAPTAYDSGLYHFNAIRWINEWPIVLGLGNLHGRLAFNQSFFTFTAYLNIFPFFKHGYNIANSLLALFLFAECAYAITSFFHVKTMGKGVHIGSTYFLFVIPAFVQITLHTDFSSPSPDIATSILQLIIFGYFLEEIGKFTFGKSDAPQTLLIFILSATAITIKLNNAGFVLAICIILFGLNLWYTRGSLRDYSADIVKPLIIPILIMTTWSLRGVLLSGCPVYPSTIGCLDTRWSIPVENVKLMAREIYSWARLPRGDLSLTLDTWDWLAPWYQRTVLNNALPVIYPVGVAVFLLFLFLIMQLKNPKIRRLLIVSIPLIAGLIYWFFTAPDLRFIGALLLIIPITPAVMIIGGYTANNNFQYTVIVLFLLTNIGVGWSILHSGKYINHDWRQGYMLKKSSNTNPKHTYSGVEILTPNKDDQCWDSELPCTPYFNEELDFIKRVIFPEFRVKKEFGKTP